MKVKRRPMPAPHIPFISLADIAWQIIIFFFMAASFTKLEAMKVDPPSSTAQAKQQQQQDKTTTVVASASGLSIDGTDIAMDRLIPELTVRLKDRVKQEDRVVILEGRKGLTHQRNVEVLYAIKKAGGIPMMAEADSENSSSSAH